MLVLAGIGVIVAGFVLRFNPLLVILTSALVTGIAAGLSPEPDPQARPRWPLDPNAEPARGAGVKA